MYRISKLTAADAQNKCTGNNEKYYLLNKSSQQAFVGVRLRQQS